MSSRGGAGSPLMLGWDADTHNCRLSKVSSVPIGKEQSSTYMPGKEVDSDVSSGILYDEG